ncbi:MAG: serine/threonine protein kinase [Gammaproteobacteria bacterium]|nr:serine/threonine protein kinase [Gammaproteobacteria bacterium]
MSLKKILTLNVLAAGLVACGGGDINISPSTTSNTTGGDTSGGGSASSVCAAYTLDGTTYRGTLSGNNCNYDSTFVDADNPLMVDVIFSDLPSNGVHVFDGSLIVGENYSTDAELSAAGITEGGDGPTVSIGAGATLAFASSDDLMVINRGSQIVANGTAAAPITITSQTDAVFGVVGPEDVQQWGGLVINGFGVTNKCSYSGTRGTDLALTGECHILSEGKVGGGESNYGGNNDADSSGTLRYVVVKHTGAEVAPGNELNGIAMNAVGSGTTVENIQVYSVYDDGIEFFGGSVNVTNYVGLYVNDDSLDIDEGYNGTIQNALIIQSESNGNRCVESDGVGSYDDVSATPGAIDDLIARGLNSAATILNMTCIFSANETGTHDPGQGLRIREAHIPVIRDSIVTSAYTGDELLGDDDFNYCIRIDNEGGPAATAGDLEVTNSIFACQDLVDGDLGPGDTLAWLDTGAFDNATYQSAEAGENPSPAAAPTFVILGDDSAAPTAAGFYSVLSAGQLIPGETVPTSSTADTYIGAVISSDDWTAGWTYGLHAGNRAQALYFE